MGDARHLASEPQAWGRGVQEEDALHLIALATDVSTQKRYDSFRYSEHGYAERLKP
jgi:hypothetical protein